MRIFDSIEALTAAAGEHLGYSDWHPVDQARVTAFAEVTEDPQWIHVDPERARQGPFGGTVAHGFLTLSLLPMLAREVYRVEGARMGVNYGLDRVRFPAPLPTGSRVRGGFLLARVDPVAGGVQVHAEVTVECEGGTKPVCVANTLSRVYV
ncbi:MaoC family dehydratase [Rhizomonospora bruguierae]|uniref:MaoC family dehydratase n=1 Tax=Rhizomonospora bruguierae TaxID=1581705 RepID=UPI001BCC61AC|nr:MaoC family dehydratase [Micromonospora sp. NBRC 107566]